MSRKYTNSVDVVHGMCILGSPMEHTMSEHGQSSIHKAELLACGCRVDPITGAAFIVCSQHAVPFVDLPEHALERAPISSRGGLKPLCPFCASHFLAQVTTASPKGVLHCMACGENCTADQIVSFGMSVDSKPTTCPRCNAVVYGACTCNPAGP